MQTCSSVSIDFSLTTADCIVGCCCCCCSSERVFSNELSLKPLKPFARFRPPDGTIDGNMEDVVRVGTDRVGDDEIAAIDGDEVIASFPVVIIDRFSTSVRSKLG